MLRELGVKSRQRSDFVDITDEVREEVKRSGIRSGVCIVFSRHTTAGITINEGADPDVQRDMVDFLGSRIPVDPSFRHSEGNSDAHIKTTLTGNSTTIPVAEGELLLGTWQSVYLCEFDGPRKRQVLVKLLADP